MVLGSVLTMQDPPALGKVGQGSAGNADEQQLAGADGWRDRQFGAFGKGFSTRFITKRVIQQRSAISPPLSVI